MATRPNRISKYRALSELSREQVAEKLDVSVRTLYRWETGETQVPDDKKLELSELFGIDVPYLMGWTGTNGGEQAA